MYPLFAAIFFASILLAVAFVALRLWRRRAARVAFACWFGAYALFVVFGTGPCDVGAARTSGYRLPWAAGTARFVAQGNRSFTSHRGNHEHAWDFVMPIGTEVLAARAGRVIEVDDVADGIGLHSNAIVVEHEDGTRAVYAHIRRGGALRKVGDAVAQGEPIAESGMVGQTLFPHLHFVVQTHDGKASVPITFADVEGGLPSAGSRYRSGNTVTRGVGRLP